MTIFFSFLTAIIGICVGSFLGRAAYALPRGEYALILRARCPSCGRALPARFSIPLVGSFLLRFHCPNCGEKQSRATFASECVFGVVCLLLYLVYGFSYLFFLYVVMAGTLLLLSLIDLDIKEVPHSLLFVILALGVLTFVFSFFDFSLTRTTWWEHLVGAFVISLPLFILMMVTGGIGGGDVKLMFCLGLLLAYKLTLVAFLFGIVAAAIAAVVLRLICGKGNKYQVPLVPFLSFGAAVAVLCGDPLIGLFF